MTDIRLLFTIDKNQSQVYLEKIPKFIARLKPEIY